jgi:FkbM family methyltransferase
MKEEIDVGRGIPVRRRRRMWNVLVTLAKRILYGYTGEPYRIDDLVLRFVSGTRPIRLRYVNSNVAVNRYDALQIKLLISKLGPGDTAIDIGAHYGAYSLIMAAKCGQDGQVISFEPDPYARKIFQRNIALNPAVLAPKVEHFACSDRSGKATLYSRGGNSQSSLARSAVEFSPEQKSEEFTVDMVSLDAYLSRESIPMPKWVKIDAEGAEIRILKGATQLLLSGAGIICELHPYAWPEFGNTFAELKQIVNESGRRMRYIDREKEVGEDPEYGAVILERVDSTSCGTNT